MFVIHLPSFYSQRRESRRRGMPKPYCCTCASIQLYDVSCLQVFPDNAVRREVRVIQVHCDDARCSWRGNVGEFEVDYQYFSGCHLVCSDTLCGYTPQVHSMSCPYTPQPCPYCRGVYPTCWLEGHVNHCYYRRVTCEFCGYETAINLMDVSSLGCVAQG